MKRARHDQRYAFEDVFQEFQIKHQLTKFYHPWTNGQVERMNRTLKEASVKKYHYALTQELKNHLALFVEAYNYARRFKSLRYLTPVAKILKAYEIHPELF